jgi:molybdenum cofactor cytidylyltransferase
MEKKEKSTVRVVRSEVECGFCLGAVILAAGRSERMGRPKLLLPWGATSVLGHLIEQWRKLGAQQIAVVCAAGDAGMQAELDRLKFPIEYRIFNEAPEQGMFSSIQCAARWSGWQTGLTHWAIVLGDQPHLNWETLHRVVDVGAAHPMKVCQPRQGGRRRHPVVLPKKVFERLADSAATDLKEFLDQCDSVFCDQKDEGLAFDINRPEEYQRALKVYFQPGKTS